MSYWRVLLPALFVLACLDDNPVTVVNLDLCADVTCEQQGFACDPAVGMCVCTNNCEVDLCEDVTCARGICNPDTGACENAPECSIETQETDCLAGSICHNQRCITDTAYCAELACERGECSIEARACVNPDACATDMECLAGNFCDDDGTCQINACDAGMINCPRGVCDVSTGECRNAETCAGQDDCLDGNYCVVDTCIPAADACAVCTGNQVCNYDGITSVSCAENEAGCSTEVDCLDDRICRAGACLTPACVADTLEPNDIAADASDWFVAMKVLGSIEATLCQSDEDFFVYDTAQDSDVTGTLLVRATVDPADLGFGELEVEVLNASGVAVASGTSVQGSVELTYDVDALNQGVYTLHVKGQGLDASGLSYTLFVDILDAGLLAACQNAPLIQGTQTGDTATGASNPLSPSCAMDAASPENIYRIELTEPRSVILQVTPAPTADLTLSLRTACEIDQTETACLNSTGSGGIERFEGMLQPGTYYVVVHPASAGGGGSYTLDYADDAPICSPGSSVCIAANAVGICNALGSARVSTLCGNGCDLAAGTCAATGDTCGDVINVPNTGRTYTFPLVRLTNAIDLQATDCVGAPTPGPDAILAVRGTPGQVATIVMTPSSGNAVLYALDDCEVASSCRQAVNNNPTSGGAETLEYIVQSTDPVFVVADFLSGSGNFTVNVSFATPTCTPSETFACMNGVVPYCSPLGVPKSHTCSSGMCDGDRCASPTGEACFEAIDVSTGVYTGNIQDFVHDYTIGTGGDSLARCTGNWSMGRDALYRVTAPEGDRVRISVATLNFDTVLYAMPNCISPVVGDTCLASIDREIVSNRPERIEFLMPAGDEAFIAVDAFGVNLNSGFGAYTMTVDISPATGCTDGEFVGCSLDGTALEYCNGGFIEPQACSSGSCLAGACTDPNGDHCQEPTLVPIGGGTFTQVSPVNNAITLAPVCLNTSTTGLDVFYQVQGNTGDVVTVTMTPQSGNAVLYALSNCAKSDTCIASVDATATGAPEILQFVLPSVEPVFVVADYHGSNASPPFDITFVIEAP